MENLSSSAEEEEEEEAASALARLRPDSSAADASGEPPPRSLRLRDLSPGAEGGTTMMMMSSSALLRMREERREEEDSEQAERQERRVLAVLFGMLFAGIVLGSGAVALRSSMGGAPRVVSFDSVGAAAEAAAAGEDEESAMVARGIGLALWNEDSADAAADEPISAGDADNCTHPRAITPLPGAKRVSELEQVGGRHG